MTKVREAYVAGHFYPDAKASLVEFLEKRLPGDSEKREVQGVLMPHAGYIYSGETAARTISRVRLKESVLILGPNHTGLGRPFSVMSEGRWTTPLGPVEIDEPLAKGLLKACPLLEDDMEAHLYEHAIEVELPFLQFLLPQVRMVPVTVGPSSLKVVRQAAECVGDFLLGWKKPVLLLASSDMNHYENDQITHRKDQRAIEAMLRVDPEDLSKVVQKEDISMCGFMPAYMMLTILKKSGATRAELVDHRTSAEASGDYSRVVGYAGMIFY